MITTKIKAFGLCMLIPAMSFGQAKAHASSESLNRYALIAGKSGVWSDNEFHNRGGMIYYLSVKDFEADSTIKINDTIKVKGFKVSIILKGKSPMLDIESKGNVISTRVMDAIRKCNAGDLIFFESLGGVHGARAIPIPLRPMEVKVVE